MKYVYIFWVDKRNDKAIINSHIQVKVPGFEPSHDIRPYNFGILSVELGILDMKYVFKYQHKTFSIHLKGKGVESN